MQFIVTARKADKPKIDLIPYVSKEQKAIILEKMQNGELSLCDGFYYQERGFKFFRETPQVITNVEKVTDGKLLITSEEIK